MGRKEIKENSGHSGEKNKKPEWENTQWEFDKEKKISTNESKGENSNRPIRDKIEK